MWAQVNNCGAVYVCSLNPELYRKSSVQNSIRRLSNVYPLPSVMYGLLSDVFNP